MTRIEFKKINFYKNVINSILIQFVIFFIAIVFYYVLHQHNFNEFLDMFKFNLVNTLFIILMFGIIIFFIFFNKIYIYKIDFFEDIVIIEYKYFNKELIIEAKISDVKLKYVPSGKSRPYLKFIFVKTVNKKILKQNLVGEWEIETMLKLYNEFNSLKKRIEYDKGNKI